MKVSVNKPSKRGGYRKPKPLRKSACRLLNYLFENEGGATKIGEELNVHPQAVCRWRGKGEVPLKWVGPLSRYLDCPKEALNFEGMLVLNNEKLDWEDIVEKSLPGDECVVGGEIEYILSGTFPRGTKSGR